MGNNWILQETSNQITSESLKANDYYSLVLQQLNANHSCIKNAINLGCRT